MRSVCGTRSFFLINYTSFYFKSFMRSSWQVGQRKFLSSTLVKLIKSLRSFIFYRHSSLSDRPILWSLNLCRLSLSSMRYFTPNDWAVTLTNDSDTVWIVVIETKRFWFLIFDFLLFFGETSKQALDSALMLPWFWLNG